jgi:hypothetical protein
MLSTKQRGKRTTEAFLDPHCPTSRRSASEFGVLKPHEALTSPEVGTLWPVCEQHATAETNRRAETQTVKWRGEGGAISRLKVPV